MALDQRKLLIGGMVVLVAVAAAIPVLTSTYKPFDVKQVDQSDGMLQCEQRYEQCTCLGELRVAESYPPQYLCKGIEWCRDINETVCAERPVS